MGYDVSVDEDVCVSSGKCVASAAYFVFDADELATVDPGVVRPADDVLLRIARACPSGAITLSLDGVEVEV